VGDGGHAAEVARVAVAMAVTLDWPAHRQAELHRAATLHDVGKLPLLHDVLVRPSALTPSEAAHVRRHPRIGEAMARGVLEPEPCGWRRPPVPPGRRPAAPPRARLARGPLSPTLTNHSGCSQRRTSAASTLKP
jgi:hypothetical protein